MDTRGTELRISENSDTTATEAGERAYRTYLIGSANSRTNTMGERIQTIPNVGTGSETANGVNAEEYRLCFDTVWAQRHLEEYLGANPGHQLREVQCVARITIHPERHAEVRHGSTTGYTNTSDRGNAMVQHSEENNNRGYSDSDQRTIDRIWARYSDIKDEPTTPNWPIEVPIETPNNINESGPMVQLPSPTGTNTIEE